MKFRLSGEDFSGGGVCLRSPGGDVLLPPAGVRLFVNEQ